MIRPAAILLLTVSTFVPAASLRADEAANTPETLLAADSVAYLRFDGFAPERQAYEKTILAGLLSNEFGPLIQDLTDRVTQALGPEALAERLLDGTDPAQLLEVQVALKQLPRLVEYLDAHGVAAGLEVVAPEAEVPQFQLTFVFPDGGLPENRTALFGGMRLLGLLAEEDVASVKQNGRSLLVFEAEEPYRVVSWQEGRHVVLTIGTMELEHTLGLVDGKRKNLAETELFATVAKFDDYPTVNRGFVNVDGVTKIIEKAVPHISDILTELGFHDLNNVRFHMGYEGKLVRSTFVLDTPGERRGWLQLLAPKGDLDPDDLPSIPYGASSMFASTIDLAGTYDTIFSAVDDTLKIFSPLVRPTIDEGLKELNRALGVDLRADILANLDSPIVAFNACTDGPLGLGMGIAIKVRDEDKMRKSMGRMVRSLAAQNPGTSVSTREVNGVTLTMVDGNISSGFVFKPTYVIHDDWLLLSLYPQTARGFAYRQQEQNSTGRPPSRWTMPDAASLAILDAQQDHPGSRITGLYISDPRATARSMLSISPVFVQMVSQFSGSGADFDISLIPNARSVIDALHKNVTVVVDDGKSISYESYSTLPIPMGMTGFESVFFFMALADGF